MKYYRVINTPGPTGYVPLLIESDTPGPLGWSRTIPLAYTCYLSEVNGKITHKETELRQLNEQSRLAHEAIKAL